MGKDAAEKAAEAILEQRQAAMDLADVFDNHFSAAAEAFQKWKKADSVKQVKHAATAQAEAQSCVLAYGKMNQMLEKIMETLKALGEDHPVRQELLKTAKGLKTGLKTREDKCRKAKRIKSAVKDADLEL